MEHEGFAECPVGLKVLEADVVVLATRLEVANGSQEDGRIYRILKSRCRNDGAHFRALTLESNAAISTRTLGELNLGGHVGKKEG